MGDIWYKNVVIKTNPDNFIKILKTDHKSKYIVSTVVLNETISNHPAFLEKLQTSANSGNISAIALMTKKYLFDEDQENFSKYYSQCCKEVQLNKIFDQVDSDEKFRMSLQEAPDQKIFQNLVNNHLQRNMNDTTTFVRLANIAVDKGMDVRGFQKDFLEILVQEPNFQHQEQIRKFSLV